MLLKKSGLNQFESDLIYLRYTLHTCGCQENMMTDVKSLTLPAVKMCG